MARPRRAGLPQEEITAEPVDTLTSTVHRDATVSVPSLATLTIRGEGPCDHPSCEPIRALNVRPSHRRREGAMTPRPERDIHRRGTARRDFVHLASSRAIGAEELSDADYH
jgi:hypothetical protein